MKRAARAHRYPCRLSSTAQKNLNAYALGAAAAGVAALALVPPAAAEIVYTRANQEVPPDRAFTLDLNHDGISDFSFLNIAASASTALVILVSPVQAGNGIFSADSGYAPAIPAGVAIGTNDKFESKSTAIMADSSIPNDKCRGPWKEARNKYLGLKFAIDGQVHFGWARLSVNCILFHPARVLLTGYAYETVAGKSITTGDIGGASERNSSSIPATPAAHLGALALGSSGLAEWRRGDTK